MTDTARTTVTLTSSIMNLVEDLVGVFGATKAQVIGNIVEYFLNDSKNFTLLNELRKRKRKIKHPDDKLIEHKINILLKGANMIPLDSFLDFLDLEESFFYERNHIWSQKFNYYVEDNKIIKNE
jgi:hypothetical protein